MDLSNLKPKEGATKSRKRLGRGEGSTLGKTSGRGQKGQRSRSGGRVRPGFEGGQMPLHRRVPKFGFTNIHAKVTCEVNLRDLERVFEAGEIADIESMSARGLVKGRYDHVKILGAGTLTKQLEVKAHKFSKSAAAAIVELGGSVEEI